MAHGRAPFAFFACVISTFCSLHGKFPRERRAFLLLLPLFRVGGGEASSKPPRAGREALFAIKHAERGGLPPPPPPPPPLLRSWRNSSVGHGALGGIECALLQWRSFRWREIVLCGCATNSLPPEFVGEFALIRKAPGHPALQPPSPEPVVTSPHHVSARLQIPPSPHDFSNLTPFDPGLSSLQPHGFRV